MGFLSSALGFVGEWAVGRGLDWIADEQLPAVERELYEYVRQDRNQPHSIVYQSGSLTYEIGVGVGRTLRRFHQNGLSPTDARNALQFVTNMIFERRPAFRVGRSAASARNAGLNVVVFQRNQEESPACWEVVARTCVSVYKRSTDDQRHEFELKNRVWPVGVGSWMELMWNANQPSVWWSQKTEGGIGSVEAGGGLNEPYDKDQFRDWIGIPLVTHLTGVGGAILVTCSCEKWSGPSPPEEQVMRSIRESVGCLLTVYAANNLLPLPRLEPEDVAQPLT